MPYIKEDLRVIVAEPLGDLIRYASLEQAEQRASNVVAINVGLVAMAMKPDTGWKYHYLHRGFGVFLAAATEYMRRKSPPIQAVYQYTSQPRVSQSEQDAVDTLVRAVRSQPDPDRDGYLNYLVSAYSAATTPPEYVRPLLTRAGMEFYNMFVSPYENEAIKKNGDIAAYAR